MSCTRKRKEFKLIVERKTGDGYITNKKILSENTLTYKLVFCLSQTMHILQGFVQEP